jgi:hypothetical protein
MARTVSGVVSREGYIIAGEGFNVDRRSDGQYVITFEPQFDRLPAVVADIYGEGLWAGDGANVWEIYPNHALVITGAASQESNTSDRGFSFIAMG